jgi:dCTP deaminase
MVLTDREIQAVLASRQVVIKPLPDEGAYSSTSLDLTLSRVLQEWTSAAASQIVCPTEKGYKFTDFAAKFSQKKTITDEGYVLIPGVFVLGWTKENVELPIYSRLAARVEGKSSLARLGIGIHVTAPTIHAGFKGRIQLEICNHGALKVKLTTGMKVCQLIFEQTLGTPDKGYKGQFYKQTGN